LSYPPSNIGGYQLKSFTMGRVGIAHDRWPIRTVNKVTNPSISYTTENVFLSSRVSQKVN